jgi:hypothetical protein
LHVSGAAHVPQDSTAPHPSAAIPHTALPHACTTVFGVQTQLPAVPPSAMAHDVCGAVHAPHGMLPPQPSGADPQSLEPHACACVCGVHTHVPGPVVELHDVCGAVHVPQLTTAHPGVTGVLPQLVPIAQTGHIVFTHCPVASHDSGGVHVPQATMPLHPLGADPHTALPQAVACVSGEHPQTPATPPPPHVSPVPAQLAGHCAV